MRAMLFTLALGAVMSEAVAEEPGTHKARGRTFNEKVTVRVWVARQKEFLAPVADQWALRRQTPKGLLFDVLGGAVNTTPDKGSEITDAAGNVYEVVEAEAPPLALWVKLKKAAPKKPQ